MAVLSKNHYESSQYVYSSNLEEIETRVTADFDFLRELMLVSGGRIVDGFAVTGDVGRPISTVAVAAGTAVSPDFVFYRTVNASEAVGAWIPDSVNYLNLQVSTVDDPNTAIYDVKNAVGEKVQVTATAGSILSHTVEVGLAPSGIPLAVITTDASNNIVSIQDARPMIFAAAPDSTTVTTDKFGTFPTSGDQVTSLEGVVRLLITKMWQQGGENWFSNGVDAHSMFVTGTWTTTGIGNNDVTWSGVSVLFDSSTGWNNTVTDGTANLSNNGDCLYVDIDRTQNATVTAAVGTLAALGLPDPTTHAPGDRIVLAWRVGNKKHVRGQSFAVGESINPATNVSYGSVMLNVPMIGADTRVAVVDDSGGATDESVVAAGLTRGATPAQGLGAAGPLKVGHGGNDESVEIGKAGSNVEVRSVGGTNLVVRSLEEKTEGLLASFLNQDANGDDVTVAKLPFDGVAADSPDLLTRQYLGWGVAYYSNINLTGSDLLPAPDASSGGNSGADGVAVTLIEA